MIVFLDGAYLPVEEARISPLDRGFLYGDGIYELTPSYGGRFVALGLHLARLDRGLERIGITNPMSEAAWRAMAEELLSRNEEDPVAVYMHVTRGADRVRFHGFPKAVAPTVFAMPIAIPPRPECPDRAKVRGLRVITAEDYRWRRCSIKSTSLLGNVLLFQESHGAALDETILYNERGLVTEASCSNVFAVVDGCVVTPPLDEEKLPGISRHITVESLRREGTLPLAERPLTLDELRSAEEVWITNSGRHIAPVVELDGAPVGDGHPGPCWELAMKIYEAQKYQF